MMNIAYAFYLDGGGNQELSNVDNHITYETPNESGYIKCTNRHFDTFYRYSYDATMIDFSVPYLTPGNTRTFFMTTSFSGASILYKQHSNLQDYWFLKFKNDFNLIVDKTNSYSDLPSCYIGTISVKSEGTDRLVRKRNNVTVVDVYNNELRKVYFPAQISGDGNKDDKKCWIKDPTYGWWPAN